MQRSQLLLSFLTLFLIFLLFPLFWNGASGRGLLFPFYLALGPLIAAAILFPGLKKGQSLKEILQKRISLLSPALLASFFGALFFGAIAFIGLLYEWLITLPLFGTILQVALIGIPLLVTLLLVGGLFFMAFFVYLVVPLVAKGGWDFQFLIKGVKERLKKPWLTPFAYAFAPFFGAVGILWIASYSLVPYLLPPESPFFALQWLFLSPMIAALLAYPLSHFFLKSEKA